MPEPIKDQYPFRPKDDVKIALALLMERKPRDSINRILSELVLREAAEEERKDGGRFK